MSILTILKERFRAALAGLVDDPTELLEQIRRSQDPKFGDYQANMAMSLGKQLRRSPREVAAEIIGRLDLADLCEKPEIAGPGFINLRLKSNWLVERLTDGPERQPAWRSNGGMPALVCGRLLCAERGQANARRTYPFDRDRRCFVPRVAVPGA